MILLNKAEPLKIEFLEKTGDSKIEKARRAAEAHRRARYNVQSIIKPGISLQKICETIEESTKILLEGEKNFGIGFPTGVSLNDCAAHFSVNPGDEDIILKDTDVLKIDFGTHVDGIIMDSAFTVCFDEKKENLLKASKEATEKGIEMIGVDACVSDIGAAVNEVMSSYEVEIDGKTHRIKPVANLNGHSIGPYKIHAGITIPQVRNGDKTRMTDDTFYALETFATTGRGHVVERGECSHYMAESFPKIRLKNAKNLEIYETIKNKIGTLPFSPRNIKYYTGEKSRPHPIVKFLASSGVLEPYPPLVDSKGSYVAQFEHTVYLGNGTKEILTRGDDY